MLLLAAAMWARARSSICLCNNQKLAKTSGTPGKTQLINHFIINKSWYMVDLPGYGFAKVSQRDRQEMGAND